MLSLWFKDCLLLVQAEITLVEDQLSLSTVGAEELDDS